jgi:hypothetical protein
MARRANLWATIVLSDRLSDPFSDEDEPNVGFGIEILAESLDEMPEQMQSSWLFDLVYQVSQQCAHHGGVAELIEELGLISLELPMSAAFTEVATPNERVGVLPGALPQALHDAVPASGQCHDARGQEPSADHPTRHAPQGRVEANLEG